MKQWLISKIPTWILSYLVKRDSILRQRGCKPDVWYWADIELWSRNDFRVDWDCSCDHTVGENCEGCNP